MEILPLKIIEKQYIEKTLLYFEGNKSQTAKALGITVKTLYNKLEEYARMPSGEETTNHVNSNETKIFEPIQIISIEKNNDKLKKMIQSVEEDSLKIQDLMLMYQSDIQNNRKLSLVKQEHLTVFLPWTKVLSNKSLAEKYNALVVKNNKIKNELINNYLK